MSDLLGNHIVGFPTRRIILRTCRRGRLVHLSSFFHHGRAPVCPGVALIRWPVFDISPGLSLCASVTLNILIAGSCRIAMNVHGSS